MMREIADGLMKDYELDIAFSRSSSDNELLKEGLDALEKKQYAIGIDKLTRHLASDADNLDVRYYLGMAHYLQGNFRETIPHLRLIADKIHSYTKKTQWVLSLVYLKTGNPEAAKTLLQKITGYNHHPYKKDADALLKKLKEKGL